MSVPVASFTMPTVPPSDDPIVAVTPLFALIVCKPVRLIAPPLSVGVPSSNVIVLDDCVPLTVTVYGPVAVVPAKNTATLSGLQGTALPLPSDVLFQTAFAALVSHVPLGDAPPLPIQYSVAVPSGVTSAHVLPTRSSSRDRVPTG